MVTDAQPKAMEGKRNRLDWLDGMRAFAAITVMIFHGLGAAFHEGHAPDWVRVLMYHVAGGHAVTAFIVISGFCLTIPAVNNGFILKKGAFEFFGRRTRRIVPTYYLSLVACIIAFVYAGPINLMDWRADYMQSQGLLFMQHFALLQDYFNPFAINAPAWTIAVEYKIYLLFPLLLLSWCKLGPFMTILWISSITIILNALVVGTDFQMVSPLLLTAFTFGMLAATICFSTDPRYKAIYHRVPWGVLAVATFLPLPLFAVNAQSMMPCVLVSTVSAMVLCHKNARLTQFLNWKPLVTVGGFSYSLYLIHCPIMNALSAVHAPWPVFLTAFPPMAIGLAYLFYLAAERPFLTKKATPQSGRPAPQVQS